METAVKPVQNGRGRKRRWPAEQKLAVQPRVPLEAEPRTWRILCRTAGQQ